MKWSIKTIDNVEPSPATMEVDEDANQSISSTQNDPVSSNSSSESKRSVDSQMGEDQDDLEIHSNDEGLGEPSIREEDNNEQPL